MTPYDDLLMDHIKNARNYRVVENADRSAEGRSPVCGDEITLRVKLEGGRIGQIGYQCVCCGICMASASIMTEHVAGREVGEGLALARQFRQALAEEGAQTTPGASADLMAVIDTARKFPARAGCADLPWRTLEALFEKAPAPE